MAILVESLTPIPFRALNLALQVKLSPGEYFTYILNAEASGLTSTRQFVWPMQETNALATHRACNWNQELPIYDPSRNMTSVKPGATVMVKVATNGHAHEYENGRASGHHKI